MICTSRHFLFLALLAYAFGYAPIVGTRLSAQQASSTPAFGYMHNQKPESTAQQVDLATVGGKAAALALVPPGDKVLAGVPFQGAALQLEGENATLRLEKPVVSSGFLKANTGSNLRFFVWIRGEGCGAKGDLWSSAPSLRLQLLDDYGNEMGSAESLFKTRGTFPWHCYYFDFRVPRDLNGLSDTPPKDAAPGTSGLYLTLLNRGGGKAFFAGVCCQVVPAISNPVAIRRDWEGGQDVGTFAPNPQYDELGMHLFYGVPSEKHWAFLDGNKAMKPIRTLQGLREFFAKNGDDWFMMQNAAARLPYLYITSRVLKMGEGFDEGWLEEAAKGLLELQDDKTGFWKASGYPNLMVTSAIACGCYAPKSLRRNDVEQVATPWNAIAKDASLPNAAKVIQTLLSNRVPNTGGWNEFCLQSPEFGASLRDNRVSLSATTAAVKLLAHAANAFSPGDHECDEAQGAIREAWEYVMRNLLLKDGTWRDSNKSVGRSETGADFLELLDCTQWLERRVSKSLSTPTVTGKQKEEDAMHVSVTWQAPDNSLSALRIYCALPDMKPELLTEKNLIGIIERDARAPLLSDPLLAVRRLTDTARKQWGITPENRGALYLAQKLKQIPLKLATGTSNSPLLVAVPSGIEEDDIDKLKYYAAGVTPYGEMTDFVEIKVSLVEAAPAAQ